MPALLLGLLLQCAGNIKMNPGPDSTPKPTNCLQLKEWNANGISGNITELLTLLHSNNVNIAAIQETKLTNNTEPLKTSGWLVVRLDRHKSRDGGLPMLIKDKIPNRRQHGRSTTVNQSSSGATRHFITMPNRQQLHIRNIYIPSRSSCSADHNTSIAHLLSNKEMSLIVGDINAHHSRWDTNTNEDERSEQLADKSIQPTTPFLTRMKLRGYRQMAGQRRPTSVWPSMTSHYYQTGQTSPHWTTHICPS